jgi:hypothetical protein
MQNQLNATKNKMGKHYLHIDPMIIVQLTCNTHTILGGRLVIHDANMQYPPLYDI